MRKHIVLMASIGIAGLIFTSQTAHAQAPLQLITVTPSSTAIQVDPGGSTKGNVAVINAGTSPFAVSLVSSPYHVEGIEYTPQFTQLAGTVDASQWVHFIAPTTGTIDAKKLLSVDYTVTVPAGTPAGGYYAVIFAETSAVSSDSSGVVSHSRVGDILYITVNGAVKSIGTATAVALPTFIASTPVAISTIVSNKGGLHFQTNIDTVVKNIFGTPVFSHTVAAYVLPQTQRKLTTSWTPKAPIGIYQIERTATLPGSPQQVPSQWVCIVQPWVIIVLIAIIIVIVAVTLRAIGRGRKQRAS